MDNLIINETKRTPMIFCDAEKGIIELSGVSIPNVATPFYEPLIKWIYEYAKKPHSETRLIFKLMHFDSDSSKSLFDIFKLFHQLVLDKGFDVVVDWYYEDEDIKEIGEDFKSLLKFPVRIIPIVP